MSSLGKLAIDHGDLLGSAGYALEAIANLLGADGSEHHLTPGDTNGLTHAVRALAGYVSAAGFALYEAAELAGALEAKQ
jgi:hypothetical protein